MGFEKDGVGAGVELGVDRRADHDELDVGVDAGRERLEVGVVRGGPRVGDAAGGHVGVADDAADAGEVLDGAGDPARAHAGDERGHHLRDPLRVARELATVLPDRPVARAEGGRHGVGDGGEVDVDAGLCELAPPARGVGLAGRRRCPGPGRGPTGSC